MSQVHIQTQSFNAGELSPLLNARFGVEKVASGCQRLRNFLLHVHGPVFRRPGMEYIGPSMSDGAKSRLIGFNFSTTTGAILEFNPGGLKVWSNGLPVPLKTPVSLPYSEAECGEIQIVQVNDTCYLTHPNHAPRKLIRYADDDWRMADIEWKWPPLGDENVRNAEIGTPDTEELLRIPTVENLEFSVPAGDVSISVSGPNLDAGVGKQAKFQRFNAEGETWTTLHAWSWTTVSPTTYNFSPAAKRLYRIQYTGPLESGGEFALSWTGGGGGTASVPMDEEFPTRQRVIDLPVGNWQASVTCPANIPTGATLTVERLKASTGVWEQVGKLKLLPNKQTFFRGERTEVVRKVRFNWTGRNMAGEATIERITFPPRRDINISVSATDGDNRTMTSNRPIFQAGHVGSYWQIAHRREASSVEIAPATVGDAQIAAETSPTIRVSGNWEVFTYGIWKSTLYLEKQVGGNWETVRSWKSNKDRNVTAAGTEPDEVLMRLRTDVGDSAAATAAATPRFVFEAIDAAVYGLVKVTSVGSLNADGKSATAIVDVLTPLHATTATALWTEGAFSGVKGYPRTVALHQGRLWFAGTRTEPMRIHGSVINDFENFRRSSFDDAGVSFTPAAQEANSVNWMLSHDTELIVGTSGDEWTLGTESGPITPTNVLMQRRSNYGSDYLPALLLNEAVIFVQRGGRKLRQVAPRSDVTAWAAVDLTVLAEHVARAGVLHVAVMSNPFSVLWGVTAAGQLIGMTFEQEQNVFGWHVHPTDGLVESVAVVRGVSVDEVWLAVLRNGKRFIERLDPQVILREFSQPQRLIYLDCAKRVESVAATELVSGLEHLEGRTVAILGDGAEQPSRRVFEGKITLETPAKAVIVGLPFTSELQPMQIDVPLRDGTARGRKFKVTRIMLTVHESLGGEAADDATGRFEKLNMRKVASPMDAAPALTSGDIEFPVQGSTRDGVAIIVRQTAPLPLNVGSIVTKFDVYGE